MCTILCDIKLILFFKKKCCDIKYGCRNLICLYKIIHTLDCVTIVVVHNIKPLSIFGKGGGGVFVHWFLIKHINLLKKKL